MVKKYIDKLEELYLHHNNPARVNRVAAKLKQTKSEDRRLQLLKILDCIDRERMDLMLAAEKYAGHSPIKRAHA